MKKDEAVREYCIDKAILIHCNDESIDFENVIKTAKKLEEYITGISGELTFETGTDACDSNTVTFKDYPCTLTAHS